MTAQIIPFIPQDAITFNHNQIRTNSLKVAEAFGKRHDNLLRAIKTIECSQDFLLLNFEEVAREVPGGDGAVRKMPMWEMTKDGFMFLVMGFTGKKAAAIKEAYINAFNAMEAHLRISAQPARQEQKDFLPINVRECMKIEASTAVASLNLSQELIAAIEKKAFSLAQEAFNLSLDHLYQRVAYSHGSSLKKGSATSKEVIETINKGDLGMALAYKRNEELTWIANAAKSAQALAEVLEREIRETIKPPSIGALPICAA